MKPYSLTMVVLLGLAGCSDVDLYSGLQERDANEMMAILERQGIPCAKKPGEEKTWGLSVPAGSFSEAIGLLKQEGYPKEDFVGVGEVFKKSGLVSSPSEERIRFMYALSQDLSETLSRIDGVLEARVHIVLPNNSPLGEQVRPSSAAVFIKYQPDADLEAMIPQIKHLVVDSIEGLTYEKVSTALFRARPPTNTPVAEVQPIWTDVLSLKLARESVHRFWTIVIGLGGAALFGCAAATILGIRSLRKTA